MLHSAAESGEGLNVWAMNTRAGASDVIASCEELATQPGFGDLRYDSAQVRAGQGWGVRTAACNRTIEEEWWAGARSHRSSDQVVP